MSHWALRTAGKSVLVTLGFVWGVCRTLKRSDDNPESSQSELSGDWDGIAQRLDQIENAISRIAAKAADSPREAAPAPPTQRDFITREEFEEGLKTLEARLEDRVEAEFEVQNLSIAALRTMIRQTDSLLERVLTGLEEAAERSENEALTGTGLRT